MKGKKSGMKQLFATIRSSITFKLLIKLLLSNFFLGFIISILVKQLVGFNHSLFFNLIEATLVFALMMGILTSGYGGEYKGRLFWIISSWIVLGISSLSLSISGSRLWLLWIEMDLCFFAWGVLLSVIPVYTAECAPRFFRGTWVIANFLSFLVGAAFCLILDFNLQLSQEFLYLLAIIASVFALILSTYLNESPPWLFEQGRVLEGILRLENLRGVFKAIKETAIIKSSLRRRSRPWQPISKRQFKTKIHISLILAVLRQLSGISVMLLYIPNLFLTRWPGHFSLLWLLIFASLALGLFFATLYVDSEGRRLLILLSFLAQAVILFILIFSWEQSSWAENLLAYLGYLFFFALGAGPVTYLSWIELMPLRGRARYNSAFLVITLATAIVIWFVGFILIDILGARSFYSVSSFLAMLSFWYCWKKLPETKGFYLEEI